MTNDLPKFYFFSFTWSWGVWLTAILVRPVRSIAAVFVRLNSGSGPLIPGGMSIYLPVLAFACVLVFRVAGEDLGWRGFALPPLLAAHGPFAASLILSAMWALWHLPLFFIPENFHGRIRPVLFATHVVASSFIYTHLHFAPKGSLIPAHLLHASFNASIGLLPLFRASRGGDTASLKIVIILLTVLACLVAMQTSQQAT